MLCIHEPARVLASDGERESPCGRPCACLFFVMVWSRVQKIYITKHQLEVSNRGLELSTCSTVDIYI